MKLKTEKKVSTIVEQTVEFEPRYAFVLRDNGHGLGDEILGLFKTEHNAKCFADIFRKNYSPENFEKTFELRTIIE